MPSDSAADPPSAMDFAAQVGLSQSDLDRVLASTVFDEQFYLKTYPEIAQAGMKPLYHFLVLGRFEGRKPSPIFDPVAYANANPDVAASGIEPFLHYVLTGKAPEGRATRGRIEVLEQQVAELTGALRRVEALERRLEAAESSLDHAHGRVDWVLGSVEGVTAQIAAYHAYRESAEYQAAYATANPLVSVCVTTMDRADVLMERSIASLLEQTYRRLQIIVVGDNCTDDTMQRLADLRDSRIQAINLTERGPYPRPGLDRWRVAGSNAVNHALSLCEGQFVTHLDDDDSMAPHRIESLLATALEERADFLFHRFWYQHRDGSWVQLGNGRLELGQVTTGSIFYHRYFSRFPWDPRAYWLQEPGDWNRLRKIRLLRPRLRYLDEPLLRHYMEMSQPAFVARDGEKFLD